MKSLKNQFYLDGFKFTICEIKVTSKIIEKCKIEILKSDGKDYYPECEAIKNIIHPDWINEYSNPYSINRENFEIIESDLVNIFFENFTDLKFELCVPFIFHIKIRQSYLQSKYYKDYDNL